MGSSSSLLLLSFVSTTAGASTTTSASAGLLEIDIDDGSSTEAVDVSSEVSLVFSTASVAATAGSAPLSTAGLSVSLDSSLRVFPSPTNSVLSVFSTVSLIGADNESTTTLSTLAMTASGGIPGDTGAGVSFGASEGAGVSSGPGALVGAGVSEAGASLFEDSSGAGVSLDTDSSVVGGSITALSSALVGVSTTVESTTTPSTVAITASSGISGEVDTS